MKCTKSSVKHWIIIKNGKKRSKKGPIFALIFGRKNLISETWSITILFMQPYYSCYDDRLLPMLFTKLKKGLFCIHIAKAI